MVLVECLSSFFIGHPVGSDDKSKLSRVIDLDIDIGADAVDYKCVARSPDYICAKLIYSRSAIANQESLSGLETEMRKLEGLVKEVVDEMNYLKKREERFTSTNCTSQRAHSFMIFNLRMCVDSTNQRVQNFAWFTIISLAGLGAWQILHLRAFFKRKYLID